MKAGWKWALNAGLVLTSGLTGLSQSATAAAAETVPAITIHVRNCAGVAPRILAEAEQVASVIFRKSGVQVRWADSALAENSQANGEGPNAFTLADIQLSIFPNVMSDGLGLPNTVMGLAPGTGSDRRVVYVFNGKVTALFWKISSNYSRRDMEVRISLGQILGHAIAHEVGHLLLNQQVHSPHGIMRGEWDLTDLGDAARGLLLFTREQAGILQSEVRRRNTPQEIAEAN